MNELNDLGPRELWSVLDLEGRVRDLVRLAVTEDLDAAGDVTTRSIVDPARTGRALLRARDDGVIAGLAAGPVVLDAFGADVKWNQVVADASDVEAQQVLAELNGSLADILAAERTLLNLIGRLSGIATLTRRYVDAVVGTGALVTGTRKTTPGYRGLEKYAARCGGATMHRLGLHDAALYKDNHLAHIAPHDLASKLTAAITAARAAHELRFIEVEVDDEAQLHSVLGLDPGLVDWVLLDNMGPSALRSAVAARDTLAPLVRLEASGGVTLDGIRAIAETGVDRISVGAITHSAPALDVGLDVAD